MKSIRTKILVSTLLIVAVALLIAGSVSSWLNYSSTLDTLNQTMGETVELAALRVSAELGGYKMLVNEIAADISESGPISITECNEIAQNSNFTSFTVSDKDGRCMDGNNISDRAYFQQCRDTMEPVVSDPILRKDNGQMNIMIVAPIVRHGVFSGIAIAGKDAKFLCDITASIQIGTGNAAILNKAGDTIGFADVGTVLEAYNTQKEALADSKLADLAEIERRMCAGETGFGSYYYNGQNKFMAYTPIPDTDGWSIDVAVVREEFLKSTYLGILWIVILSVIILAVAAVLIVLLANSIARPIKLCAGRLEKLAEKGDLKSSVPAVHTRDETGVLAAATKKLVDNLGTIISDADYQLGEMAAGNFDVKTRADGSYVGDFESLKHSMSKINTDLSDTLSQINLAADQVASGSDQVSSGAQALSQGATEQASSVEELAATINEISGQISENASNAVQASSKVNSVGGEAADSNSRMQQMLEAMAEISQSSGEIGKIMKTIEDIAFQTNILALNAAVEAARAGAAGKGFAVVADEVRNLANKSQEASKNTAVLIESSLKAVENGTRIADETAKALSSVVDGVKQVTKTIDLISVASGEQAQSVAQVTQGIDQISAVVQTNSATAEESAAASEELSSQAQMLKDLVGRFQLKDGAGTPSLQYEEISNDFPEYPDFGPDSKY